MADPARQPLDSAGRAPDSSRLAGAPIQWGMSKRSACVVGLAVAALLAVAPASAQDGKTCVAKGASSVQLVILASPAKVKSYAGTIKKASVVARDETTVVLDDGRVITSNLESATKHLNTLGWAQLPIQVVASFAQAPPRQRAKG